MLKKQHRKPDFKNRHQWQHVNGGVGWPHFLQMGLYASLYSWPHMKLQTDCKAECCSGKMTQWPGGPHSVIHISYKKL